MLKLVCIDVDGTLVGSSREPTQAVWQAAEAAVAAGQHLALSTGRGGFGPTLDYARRLDPNGWHIFHNGAALLHAGTGETRTSPLGDDVIELATDVAERNGWVIEYSTADDYAVSPLHDLAIEHAVMLGVEPRDRHRSTLDGPIVRLQFVVPLEVVPWVQAEMVDANAVVAPARSPVMPGTAFVSATSPGVSKGAAIARIAEEIGTTIDEVMMVGDGHNDLDAIEAVGHGVAMGNSVAEVLDAADHVVGHVDNDGLVEALALAATL